MTTVKRKRDLTQAQFNVKCAKLGIVPSYMGYYYVTPDRSLMIYAGNAGVRRRDQLAYLIKQQAKNA